MCAEARGALSRAANVGFDLVPDGQKAAMDRPPDRRIGLVAALAPARRSGGRGLLGSSANCCTAKYSKPSPAPNPRRTGPDQGIDPAARAVSLALDCGVQSSAGRSPARALRRGCAVASGVSPWVAGVSPYRRGAAA